MLMSYILGVHFFIGIFIPEVVGIKIISSKLHNIESDLKLNAPVMELLGDIGTKQLCMMKCEMTANCGAINYHKLNENCEMIDANNLPATGLFAPGWIHSEVVCDYTIKRDCSDLLLHGCYTSDGVYSIQPDPNLPAFEVYCDMSDGGWTVIQKRFDGTVSFYDKLWQAYKNGFGDLNGEYWLGNDNIHTLTTSGSYEIKFDLQDYYGVWFDALYESFSINAESDNYRLSIGPYMYGTTTDSINIVVGGNTGAILNGQEFSTADRDNDAVSFEHCVAWLKSGGWWHKGCSYARLNSKYSFDGDYISEQKGIPWRPITENAGKSLKATTMKVRRGGI
ncbi:unnamed protein product [Owenia fusiformis]|uniref:Uncharacterized protein n=1 Tax=Owenia fusiformis TaxID=6347 RepID=A0A8J1T6T9_OWEFU|nr:unnamed protein product [Owenia fusiformis]